MEAQPKRQGSFIELWRSALVGLLFIVPLVGLMMVGTWVAWHTERWAWLLWLPPTCWAVAYLLTLHWKEKLLPTWKHDPRDTPHWTARDDAAMKLVEQYQEGVKDVPPERLVDPHFYLQAAMDLSQLLARHYHPKARDPLGPLTVTEILAAGQLALEDSANWIRTYVPGSHLLTIDHWRTLSRAPRWIKWASDAAWAVSLLFNPAKLGTYLASRVTAGTAGQQIQTNLLISFYGVYLHYVGQYLIEMNSGRLRGGAANYRAALGRLKQDQRMAEPRKPSKRVKAELPHSSEHRELLADGQAHENDSAANTSPTVTIVLAGQAGAGKTSLLRALAQGSQWQEVQWDQQPSERVREFALQGAAHRLVWIDTPGYGAVLDEQRQDEIRQAARRADVMLLVMNAASPARRADSEFLQQTLRWFHNQARLKPPVMLGVLTHVDALSPVMEWSPPYDWARPVRPKEQSIHGAVRYCEELFGTSLTAIIPVCTGAEEAPVWGVQDALIPAILSVLDHARAVAFLRSLHQEMDRQRISNVVDQLQNVGRRLLGMRIEGRRAGARDEGIRDESK